MDLQLKDFISLFKDIYKEKITGLDISKTRWFMVI